MCVRMGMHAGMGVTVWGYPEKTEHVIMHWSFFRKMHVGSCESQEGQAHIDEIITSRFQRASQADSRPKEHEKGRGVN